MKRNFRYKGCVPCPCEAHLALVAFIAHGQGGGEGLQVSGLGQLGHQRVRVHMQPLPPHARAQVQVQAALKDVVDEAAVGRHLPCERVRACVRVCVCARVASFRNRKNATANYSRGSEQSSAMADAPHQDTQEMRWGQSRCGVMTRLSKRGGAEGLWSGSWTVLINVIHVKDVKGMTENWAYRRNEHYCSTTAYLKLGGKQPPPNIKQASCVCSHYHGIRCTIKFLCPVKRWKLHNCCTKRLGSGWMQGVDGDKERMP
eukprot:scaffold59607_cov20-Tisochrysis_lutea.AAC.1